MIETSLPLLAFAGVAGLMACLARIIYDWLFGYCDAVGARLSEEFGAGPSQPSEQIRLFKDLSKFARQSEEETQNQGTWLERVVEQSGWTISVRQVLVASVAGATFLAGVLSALAQPWWVAALGFALALPIPVLLVAMQRERRLNKLRQQLPDAFEMMSRTIRAGQTVTRAFQTVADDFQPPIAEEFAWCFEQQNFGLPQDLALQDLARRSGITELRMLVVALLVQRQSGGSPVELLDNLAAVVRKRIEMQEKIRTLTAEGRLQATVLLIMPPLLMAVITMLNPGYVDKLWERPELLAGMLVSELIGVAWIRQILRLEF
ncbi:MAG TPA: type II secretion system F family protein [Planctomycetaceae bacterium]|nr:type II secretion system F family protein [Planctomycetaceae bacterium]